MVIFFNALYEIRFTKNIIFFCHVNTSFNKEKLVKVKNYFVSTEHL